MSDDDDWFEKRPQKDRSTMEIIGRDQNGRAVYADRCVVLPGTRRPDGTRRKDRRIRAEQLADGSWKSFVPQDEVQSYETRAVRQNRTRERTIPGYSGVQPQNAPQPKKEAPKKSSVVVNKVDKGPPLHPESEDTRPLKETAETEDELRKRMKNLRKKLKHIVELAEKASEGIVLDADQQDKLRRADTVQAELTELEIRLAALPV